MANVFARGAAWAARWVAFACAVLASSALAQLGVSEGGQPSYSIAIQVPPGRAGMEPKLALVHGGQTVPDGVLGPGWSLTGLSVITRCGSTLATDGVRKGVRYTADDRLCLDGQRLIQTDASGNPTNQATYGAANTEYRTEKDSFARIRAIGGTAASGAGSFKVWTKAGLIYEYGATTDSRILTSRRSPAVAMAWAVNRISDTAGNYISFEYTVQENTVAGSAGREWLLARIRYTGHRTGQAPFARVEFGYETRPDATEAWHEGAKSVSTRRLASIRTYVGTGSAEAPVLAMLLAYRTSTATGRSLLESVRVCDGAATSKCLPATRFIYTPGPGMQFASRIPSGLSGASLAAIHEGRGVATRGPLQGDFNGDGRQDILVWDENPSQNRLWAARADGSFVDQGQAIAAPIGHGDGCHAAIVADFDLDGVADVLQLSEPEADSQGKCSGVTRTAGIYPGRESGQFGARVPIVDETGRALTLTRADPRYTGAWTACLPNEPADSCTGVAPAVILRGGSTFYVSDVNGDGVPDLLVTNSQPGINGNVPNACAAGERTCLFLGSRERIGVFTKVATSLAQQDLFSPRNEAHGRVGVPGTYAENRVFIGDLNSDGLPDLLVRDRGDRYIATGVPGQFVRQQGGVAPCMHGLEVLDINGDGKWDLACMDPVRDGPYQAYVNDGAGNFTLRSTIGSWVGRSTCEAGSPTDPNPQPCEPTAYRGRVVYLAADLDGDGISDILATGKRDYAMPGSRNAWLRGARDGSFQRVATNLDDLHLSVDRVNFLIGDFTGRGALELFRYGPDPAQTALLTRSEGVPADLLKAVISPEGAQTTLEYKPLTDPALYTKGRGATHPAVDITGGQWFVSALNAPDGLGGTQSTTFRYATLRADLAGRGSLGFETVERTAPALDGSRIVTTSKYRQDFPFTGLPVETRRALSAATGQPFSLVRTEYEDWHASGCADRRIFRPLLKRTTEESRDLNGKPIAKVETANAGYTCFGDVGTVTVTTTGLDGDSRVYRKVTTNTWSPPNTSGEQWILGRLASATQANTVPDYLPAPISTPAAPSVPSTPPAAAPTLDVQVNPQPLVAGSTFEMRWNASGFTSLSYKCTSSGAGFVASGNLSSGTGVITSTAKDTWVGYPSTCLWTAQGAGGTKTLTYVLTTTRSIALDVQVTPSPLQAGQNFTVRWTTSGATSVGYKCTASGTGLNATATMPTTSGTTTAQALPQWVGYPSTCLWTAQGANGTRTTTVVLTTIQPLDLQVSLSPDPLVVGQPFQASWTSVGATSISYRCTAAGTGFNGAATVTGASGSVGGTGVEDWVNYPSTCEWTATGPGGTKKVTQVLRTVRPAPPAPTLTAQLSRSPVVAGQPFTVTWATTNAASVSYKCTAAGTGYNGTVTLPTTGGSSNEVAQAAWVGYPSSCVWTAVGPGGTRTLNMTLTTVAGPPTIEVRFDAHPLVAGRPFEVRWSTTGATAVSYQCTASGSGYVGNFQLAPSGVLTGTGMFAWVGNPSSCVWTATGPGGSTTYRHTMVTQLPG